MTKGNATAISDVLGGDIYEWKPDDYIVRLPSDEGRIVAIFDNLICQFENEEDFEGLNAATTFAIY